MQFAQFLSKFGKGTSAKSSQHLFRQNERNPFLYFVQKGLLKAYYINEDGKEFIKSFIAENDVIGSINSGFNDGVCTFNVECLEDCELLKIDFATLRKAASTDIEISNAVQNLLVMLAMKKEKREYDFLCVSAENRYKQICQENPSLLQRVTQQDIALYLGITPVALSRIKGRIK